MIETARDFLVRCFAPGSTIALLLRTESPAKIQQRIVTLEQALAPRYLGWLAHENHHDANVYVAANPLRFGTRKRTKESIASVRHVYLDIDEDGDTRLALLRASEAVPPASAVLSTSPGKYQIFWRVEGFDFEQQELTLKRLAIVFGGDPACTDCNRVLRIPGFANRKYSPAHTVTVEYGSPQPWEPTDFQLEELVEVTSVSARRYGTRKLPHRVTHSEDDWAFVCAELADGKDAGKLTHELASRRTDKPNPLYYAQRTVDVASARQWFLEGTTIDDVITMLHERRRFELPTALCSARAREIATTALRTVARLKTA
jgi:RepB DNA-primase from phage plasmid